MKNWPLGMDMGGYGSGRREYARTPTVEECRHLDVDEFTDAVEQPGTTAVVRWGDSDDPDASIAATMLPEDGDAERATALRLSYTATDPRADETRDREYVVSLDYTECHFGGARPWFRCPEKSCGERVGKLYKPPRQDLYLCRECFDLGYRSSRTSGNEMRRAEQRYRKAFAKADAENRAPHPNNAPYLPERPKGMHHDTFEDLCDDVEAARREWDNTMRTRLRELTERYGDPFEDHLPSPADSSADS